MYRVFTVITILSLLQLTATAAYAADCTIIYGGGEMTCANVTPTTTKASPTPVPVTQTSPTQSKGGLPVHKQTTAPTTPATGPEMLSLVSLIPLAGAGIWLRKKTNSTFRD